MWCLALHLNMSPFFQKRNTGRNVMICSFANMCFQRDLPIWTTKAGLFRNPWPPVRLHTLCKLNKHLYFHPLLFVCICTGVRKKHVTRALFVYMYVVCKCAMCLELIPTHDSIAIIDVTNDMRLVLGKLMGELSQPHPKWWFGSEP